MIGDPRTVRGIEAILAYANAATAGGSSETEPSPGVTRGGE